MMKHVQSLLLLKLGVLILLIVPSYICAKKITSIKDKKHLESFILNKDYVIMLIGNRFSKQVKEQKRIINHAISSSKLKKVDFGEIIHPSLHSEEIMKLFSFTKKDLPCTVIYSHGVLIASQKGMQQKKELLTILKKISKTGSVVTITDADFEMATAQKGYHVVDFGTPKSDDSLKFAPHVEALAKKLNGKMSFYKININKNLEYAEQYEVNTTPTVLIFKDGEMIKKLVGYRNKIKLLYELTDALSKKVNKVTKKATSKKEYVISITDAQFEDAISKGFVFVDFWAPWSDPCLKLAPHVKNVAKKLKDKMAFYKINTDNNSVYANKYEIIDIPTLLVFKDGEMIKKLAGLPRERKIDERNQRYHVRTMIRKGKRKSYD